MQNIISERVADFLRHYPPFEDLLALDLNELSYEVTILYKEKNSIVFREGEVPHECFYVVHKGAVSLTKTKSNNIIDICDEGDIFGLRPLMANENYRLEARTNEESILYGIPIAYFKPLAQENRQVGTFLIESFASNTRNPYSESHRGKLLENSTEPNSENNTKLLDLQSVNYSIAIVSCTIATSIKEAGLLMTKNNVGSILVYSDEKLTGIITDKDFRNHVISGDFPVSAQVEEIMTSPVITYPSKMTITQAHMAMMKNDIGHLVLTQDGTPNSKVVGVLSKHDVMVAMGDNPMVLMKAIKRCKTSKQLKRIRNSVMQLLRGYLEQNIPMQLTTKIISELNDASIKQIIKVSLSKMDGPPPVKFAWLAMGSQGRGEQLLHTDQDNAIIFEDVAEKEMDNAKTYFQKLADLVTIGLNDIGYEFCPADMMASNPRWCHSLSEWKNVVAHWVNNPGPDEVLLSSIFFDYNRSYGDKNLVESLSKYIFEQVKTHRLFLAHLAIGALKNPSPTGFFRSFLVEQDGAHKDFFDLKQRAIMPLVDAARVLILSYSIDAINNTAERYQKLAELEPQNEELFLSCCYASKALLKFRTKQGLLHNDSGRFIALDQLTKEEKIKLKRTFKTIKEIQELIAVRFQTSTILA
ncbi:MAG: DUF294 nucleotidyltransferase-like domain-containing protein [Bacteroidota bacterium]